MSTYLKIGTTNFAGSLTPSEITPGVEIIKNEERSIDGTMNIDVVSRKRRLEVLWSVLSQADMAVVMSVAENIQPQKVYYIDPIVGTEKEIDAYAGEISYLPLFISDKIMWRDVKLVFAQV